MDKHEAYEVICKQLQKEIDQIADQMQKNQTMSQQDLDRLDKMYHLKKSMKTVKAMEESEEYSEGGFSGTDGMNQNGNSGYRGRAMNGRFVSRAANGNSYSDGYTHGYSEAMNQMNGNSGHYMPYYDEPRRW